MSVLDDLAWKLRVLIEDGDNYTGFNDQGFDQWRILGTLLTGEMRLEQLRQQARIADSLEDIAKALDVIRRNGLPIENIH